MSAAISEQDLKVFVEAIGNFFDQLDGVPAEVRAAFLQDRQDPLQGHDFTGVIDVGGAFSGQIVFSAPRVMLRRVLMCLQEPRLTEENFLDAAGEIANIFAGNARRHFGERLDISVPRIHAGGMSALERCSGRAFVVVIGWLGYKACLLIDLVRL